MILPNIENILHFSEEQLLQIEVQHSMELQHLYDLMEQANSRSYTKGLNVRKTVAILQHREVKQSPSPRIWIIGIIIALTGSGIVWLIWVMSPGTNYPCIRRPKRTHEEGHELNKSNIELQVEHKEMSDTTEDTPGENPGGHSHPTVFVQHRRVEAHYP